MCIRVYTGCSSNDAHRTSLHGRLPLYCCLNIDSPSLSTILVNDYKTAFLFGLLAVYTHTHTLTHHQQRESSKLIYTACIYEVSVTCWCVRRNEWVWHVVNIIICIMAETSKSLNFNVGILGHIDSGKTSLGMHHYITSYTLVGLYTSECMYTYTLYS